MADVAIKRKPTVTPNVSAPSRGSNGARSLTVKWSVGDWCKKGTREDRIEGFRIEFYLYCYSAKNLKKRKTLHYIADSANPNRTEWTLWLTNFKCGKTTYTRDSFYPMTEWCLRSVKATVKASNRKGYGPYAAATMNFGKPRTPSITMSQNAQTGDVSFTVKHNKGEDWKELWNTQVWHSVWDSSKPKGKQTLESAYHYFGSNETQHTWSTDVADRMGKTYDQYTCVTVTARDRGLWGYGDKVERKLYIGWPKQPTVSVRAPETKGTNEKVTVVVSTNSTTQHPVTGVKLEKLVNVDYNRASEIPGDANWQECGAEDDGNCKALSSTVAELMPEAGKRTWVRVKSWNQIENIFYIYSTPQRVRALETTAPTAADDDVKIIGDVRPGDDGESAVVLVAWNDDDSDGTEVSWSADPNAWRSTKSPSTFDVTYDDGEVTEGTGSSAVTWDHSATLHIADIERGTKYYVRARRYRETDNDREYGPYYPDTGDVSVTPTTSPTSATLVAPASVPRGQSLSLSWTFDGGGEQSEWQLLSGEAIPVDEDGNPIEEATTTTTTSESEDEPPTRYLLGDDVNVVMSGTDATGACSIPAERVEGLLDSDGQIALAVLVSTGGTPVQSDALIVTVDDPPTLAIDADTVTAQPLEFDVACTSAAALSVVVTSLGTTWDTPSGMREQVEGDQVWAQALTPTWTGELQEDETTLWTATVTAPANLPLMDDATYRVSVVATDLGTGLESEAATCDVGVAYARKAPEPSASIAITPYDTTDADSGARTRGCAITFAAPTSGISTDVYDLYRVTPDGAYPVAEGLLTDAEVDDPYAPYGTGAELAYRISCRTVDGCEYWLDYPYVLAGGDLRIDYEGPHGMDYVELPYNLVISDSRSKDFEVRGHLDGSVDGYSSPIVKHDATVRLDLFRDEDEATKRRVIELSESVPHCWVRTPVGQAYEAIAQVSGYGTIDHKSSAVPVAMDVHEVRRTGFGVSVAPTDEDGETSDPDEEEESEEA